MSFRIGLAQCCHPADGDVIGMVDKWATQAANAGVDLLVFPESLMTPFELSDGDFAQEAQPIDGPFCTAMDEIAARHGLWMIYTANERNSDGADVKPPFNTAIAVDPNGVKQAVYRKVHLFDTDFVRESDKVTPGDTLPCTVETPFATIGIAICYDLRFPEQARAMALAGCDLIVYPAAWVDGPHKVDQWRTLLAARAVENEVFVAGLSRCDRAFGKARRDYAGHSCVFGPLGEELASAETQGTCAQEDAPARHLASTGIAETLLTADIDPEAIARARAAMPILAHRRPELY